MPFFRRKKNLLSRFPQMQHAFNVHKSLDGDQTDRFCQVLADKKSLTFLRIALSDLSYKLKVILQILR